MPKNPLRSASNHDEILTPDSRLLTPSFIPLHPDPPLRADNDPIDAGLAFHHEGSRRHGVAARVEAQRFAWRGGNASSDRHSAHRGVIARAVGLLPADLAAVVIDDEHQGVVGGDRMSAAPEQGAFHHPGGAQERPFTADPMDAGRGGACHDPKQSQDNQDFDKSGTRLATLHTLSNCGGPFLSEKISTKKESGVRSQKGLPRSWLMGMDRQLMGGVGIGN
jgi:hypothetical protein